MTASTGRANIPVPGQRTLVIRGTSSHILVGELQPSEGSVAERKVKVDYMGKMLDGIEVSIDESTERWSDIKLSDGTVIRGKIGLVGATRVPGEYDQDGNPAYVFKMAPTVVVGEAPASLRKK